MEVGTVVAILFVVVSLLAALAGLGYGGYLIARIFRQMRQQKAADDASPIENATGRVVTKRTNVSGFVTPNSPISASASYYCTFEFADGARQEFQVGGTEFGLLAEGDTGLLTFQGSRYKGFQRQKAVTVVATS